MCDTLVVRGGGAVWFAKNSDREPGEVQRVERHAAVADDTTEKLACTHIEIDQVPDREATILSRPSWMWGAEMGVNASGVVIGNEAVFSRKVMKRGKALLGMDLVRLGLERGSSAHESAAIIIHLLETHGQGGPAGWRDKGFRYDNSFLIADAAEILVLETCGRDWRLERVKRHAAISNAYTLEGPVTMASEGAPTEGFGASDETWLRPTFGRVRERRACALAALERLDRPDFASLAKIMRSHDRGDGFTKGSNRDLCLHHGGLMRPSHTTNSMLVRLAPGEAPAIAMTGTKTPCVSLFRPVAFDGASSLFSDTLWEQGSKRNDALARDPSARQQVRNRIAAAEAHILPAIEAGRPDVAEALVTAWDDHGLDAGSGKAEIDAPSS
ncbi:peptidase family C69 [Maricaulis maris]|uniref:peptidase family C69 n=1 Tax=Maricaulis maris TaxID=74318 RepID=UPI003A8CC3BE